MADVPDHLVPQDGLTNSFVRFDGLDMNYNVGMTDVRFGIYNEGGHRIADFVIPVPDGESASASGVIAAAHRDMTDVLRQWLYMIDTNRRVYERQEALSRRGIA